MGVQGVSISQNSSCKSLNITHLTAIKQYKWDHKKIKPVRPNLIGFLFLEHLTLINNYWQGVLGASISGMSN